MPITSKLLLLTSVASTLSAVQDEHQTRNIHRSLHWHIFSQIGIFSQTVPGCFGMKLFQVWIIQGQITIVLSGVITPADLEWVNTEICHLICKSFPQS